METMAERFEDVDLTHPGRVEPTAQENLKSPSSRRAKSSLRFRYEAEVQTIKRKIGDLEGIRQSLGLSQRKICQLLLVDPSAWSRWTRTNAEPPPHIYRAFQWYLAAQEKYPALDVGFWLQTVARSQEPAQHLHHDQKLKELQEEIRRLQSELHDMNRRMLESPSSKNRRTKPLSPLRAPIFFGAVLASGIAIGLSFGFFWFG